VPGGGGIVEVHGDDPVSGRLDQPAGGERRPCPDGVAERDLLAAQLVQSPGERGHPFAGDRPFVGAAEHTGEIGPHRQAGGPPGADERLQALEAITRQQRGVTARQGGVAAVRYDRRLVSGGQVT
jgi:hypothetical protein